MINEDQVGTEVGLSTRVDHVRNVSQRKIGVVSSASFDTLIEAITGKSEKAQCTFIFRLLKELDGEVLASTVKYATQEVKSRTNPSGTDKSI